MDTKYQIFISSTYEDLKQQRHKVRDTILSMNHFPVGMELFGAADEDQWEIIKQAIDTSDYYVLIIGNRYGSVIETGENAGMSYTEKEYRYAKDQKIPILAFILRSENDTNDKDLEDETKQKKLAEFKRNVIAGRLVDFWITEEDLATKVSTALYKQMSRSKRPGWIRGDLIDVEKSLQTIVDLNTQVKTLKEENEYLLSKIESRNPKLELDLLIKGNLNEESEDTSVVVTAQENEYHILLMRKQIKCVDTIQLPQKITMSDVPERLKDYVSSSDIEKFNNDIPTLDETEQYYSGMREYYNVTENGCLIDFIVSNDGTAKATNISIDFEFPEQFIIMKRKNAEGFHCPVKPTIPENPIIEAERRINAKSVSDLIGASWLSPSKLNISSIQSTIPLPDFDFSDRYHVDARDGKVSIWLSDLMHTKEWIAKDIYIVPKETGKYIIPGYLMCEEYPYLEKVSLIIEVVDR